jgi:hypothetical protein
MDKKRKAKLKPLQVEFRHPDTKEWIKTEILYDPKDKGFDTALIWDAINEVEGMGVWAWESSLDSHVEWTDSVWRHNRRRLARAHPRRQEGDQRWRVLPQGGGLAGLHMEDRR